LEVAAADAEAEDAVAALEAASDEAALVDDELEHAAVTSTAATMGARTAARQVDDVVTCPPLHG
jgi:hypothetical protein